MWHVILSGIDTSSVSGKRDYAVLILLMTYGLRVKDLIGLKIENIDFQHCQLSFTQSKTGRRDAGGRKAGSMGKDG